MKKWLGFVEDVLIASFIIALMSMIMIAIACCLYCMCMYILQHLVAFLSTLILIGSGSVIYYYVKNFIKR